MLVRAVQNRDLLGIDGWLTAPAPLSGTHLLQRDFSERLPVVELVSGGVSSEVYSGWHQATRGVGLRRHLGTHRSNLGSESGCDLVGICRNICAREVETGDSANDCRNTCCDHLSRGATLGKAVKDVSKN